MPTASDPRPIHPPIDPGQKSSWDRLWRLLLAEPRETVADPRPPVEIVRGDRRDNR